MSDLALRRGTVVSVELRAPDTAIVVEVDGVERRAIAYEQLTGPVEVGDEVVVNIAASELGLGSGGFDLVHVNLTRGLTGDGPEGANVMKLNYTSLQHAVVPVEEKSGELELPVDGAVGVISLHAQLPCVAWALAQARPGTRLGYVQTAGGALPGALSRTVRALREQGLLAGHVTAGPAFGGEHDAVTVTGGLHAGLVALDWDAAVVGPGPGILGSATALGHGGLAALDNAHAALALGCRVVIVPRMSSGDPRPRHRGLSHHTRTVLDLLLRPTIVAMPAGEPFELPQTAARREAEADLEGYAASGLPARTMGRALEEDELFFRAALAGGAVLAEEV